MVIGLPVTGRPTSNWRCRPKADAHRRDIGGAWQGTLSAGQQLRVVIQITKAADGTLTATMYSIDQSPTPIPVSSIKLDGASIAGTWTQRAPRTLVLERADVRSAWPLDPSPHTVRFVTVDHDVKLEVLDFGV
jgi:hypothetical protein